MYPERFLSDLELKPSTLRQLADLIEAGEAFRWPAIDRNDRLVLTGMGSSWFAAQVAAQRLRRIGIAAVAEIASAEQTWPVRNDLTVIAISASGASAETLDLVGRLDGAPRLIALTNTDESPLRSVTTHAVDLHAGIEVSGIACRSALHAVVALLALEQQLGGSPIDLARACRAAAQATDALLATRDGWLAEAAERLAGPTGTWLLAPTERITSALQGALMIREVPRRPADGCETGDWSHVDVYLTKSVDYRALVFPGSRYDGEASRWMSERSSTVVAVHAEGAPGFAGATLAITYPAGGHPLTQLLVETTVPELVADHWFTAGVTIT